MTRIHYQAIATVLKEYIHAIELNKMVDLVDDLCVIFQADNDRFDSDKFREAVGLMEERKRYEEL